MGNLNLGVDVDEEDATTSGVVADVVDEDAPPASRGAAPDVVDEDAEASDKLPPHAVPNGDGSVTLPLKFPRDIQIRKDGKVRTESYAQLVFHRLTGADQRAIAAASKETMDVVAFSRSTRIRQAIMDRLFDKMDAADIAAGGEVLVFFISSGRRTGRPA